MKKIITILSVTFLSLAVMADLYLPIKASVDASPDSVTGFNVYKHCPGCPNSELIGTNVSSFVVGTNTFPIVFGDVTNYFKLPGVIPLGTQLWATQRLIDGNESDPSPFVTSLYTMPPSVQKPIKK